MFQRICYCLGQTRAFNPWFFFQRKYSSFLLPFPDLKRFARLMWPASCSSKYPIEMTNFYTEVKIMPSIKITGLWFSCFWTTIRLMQENFMYKSQASRCKTQKIMNILPILSKKRFSQRFYKRDSMQPFNTNPTIFKKRLAMQV